MTNQPDRVWLVIDPQEGPQFVAGWEGAAHEHIVDAINCDIPGAAQWVVREYRLHRPASDAVRAAFDEWLSKSEWVQDTATPGELGMHRADVLRQRIERLAAERDALRAEVERLRSDVERLRAAALAVCNEADARYWVLGRPVPVPPHALDNLRGALYENARAAQEGQT